MECRGYWCKGEYKCAKISQQDRQEASTTSRKRVYARLKLNGPRPVALSKNMCGGGARLGERAEESARVYET
jgi:hypothetical protein